MDTQNKIHFSNILRQELHAIKVQLWAIEVEKIPNDQKLPLEFNQKLETHWEALFSSLPQFEPLFLGPTILDRKFDLIQWINKLSTYFEGEILGKPYHLFLPATQSSSAKIWGRSDKWYLSEEVREFDGDSYWFAIFRNLDGWRRQSQAILEEIDWEISDQEVELIFKWHGPFKSIEQVEIESPRTKYWDISFTDESIGNSENAKATTFLLNVQIGVQNGLNSLEPVNLSKNQLTTSLKMPMAEFGEQKEISTIPSNADVDLIVDYFISLARPHYIETSKQLEVELTKDFHRWQQETAEVDRDRAIEQRQKETINKLVSIRQALFGEEQGEKTLSKRGKMAEQTFFTLVGSPLGEILLAGNEYGLTQVSFQDGKSPLIPAPNWQRDDAVWATAVSQLTAYFAGELQTFDLQLAPKGTTFQQEVWAYLQTIPYDRTTTFSAIAHELGKPNGARAVGTANGRNPIAIIIPCHRVIGSDGQLTGYAGGLQFKAALLGLERNGRIEVSQQDVTGY